MPILDEHTLDVISHSPEQTRRFGARLGQVLRPGDIICLKGDLGTGKTCLTQGIGQGLGIVETITSPTFTLIAEYTSPKPAPPLYHIDLYRLTAPVAASQALGLDEYLFGDGVCVIEWADRIRSALPPEHLWITLDHMEHSKRSIMLQATGKRYDDMLQDFRRSAFGI